MAYRKRGDRSKILLNSVDVLILDILDKNRDEITMLSLSKILKLNSLSERTHINRLVNHKFIIKKRVIGQYYSIGRRSFEDFWEICIITFVLL